MLVRRLIPFVTLAVGLVAGIIVGITLDRHVMPLVLRRPSSGGNPYVTKDNYARIQPGFTEWAISDILGSGDVVAEQGYVVDSAGNYRKFNRQGGTSSQQSGTITPPPTQPSEDITQERAWSDGDKLIRVTFHNHTAVSKSETGLFR